MVKGMMKEKLIGGEFDREKAEDLLYKMVLTRTFEENALDMFSRGKVHGTMHVSIGQ